MRGCGLYGLRFPIPVYFPYLYVRSTYRNKARGKGIDTDRAMGRLACSMANVARAWQLEATRGRRGLGGGGLWYLFFRLVAAAVCMFVLGGCTIPWYDIRWVQKTGHYGVIYMYILFVDMASLAPTLEPIGRGAVLGRAVCEWKWPVAAKKNCVS